MHAALVLSYRPPLNEQKAGGSTRRTHRIPTPARPVTALSTKSNASDPQGGVTNGHFCLLCNVLPQYLALRLSSLDSSPSYDLASRKQNYQRPRSQSICLEGTHGILYLLAGIPGAQR